MAEWSNLKKYGNGYNVNLPSNGSLIINVEWLNVYESDSGQWKISGIGNNNFEIEQTVIKDKIISIKIYRKSGNSTNYEFAISYYDKKDNQKDYIDLNITIVSAVNNSINKEDFLNRFKEFLYYRTILGQSADMPEEEWFYNYYVSTYKKTPNFKKFELEKDFDVESLRKNILILPEGIDHTKYYIYDHNEDDKYSSFIPWW